MGGVAAQHKILFLFISSMIFRHVGMLQQISSNKKIYACPHVGAPFLWGPLCGRTGRTCLNPPLSVMPVSVRTAMSSSGSGRKEVMAHP